MLICNILECAKPCFRFAALQKEFAIFPAVPAVLCSGIYSPGYGIGVWSKQNTPHKSHCSTRKNRRYSAAETKGILSSCVKFPSIQ
jgi:hypothetical protein